MGQHLSSSASSSSSSSSASASSSSWRGISTTKPKNFSIEEQEEKEKKTKSKSEAEEAHQILKGIESLLKNAFRRNPEPRALSAEETAPIRKLCEELTPSHFQLKIPTPALIETKRLQQKEMTFVKYQHIWEDELFSMGIFIIPPGGSIPLHDHPGMSVISRVLYGTLHVKAMDLVLEEESDVIAQDLGFILKENDQMIAKVCTNERVLAPHTSELLPDHGNLHEFIAGEDIGCAIFDILTPPYDLNLGRDCTYYRILEEKMSKEGEQFVSLEEFEPEDFDVVTIEYKGPLL